MEDWRGTGWGVRRGGGGGAERDAETVFENTVTNTKNTCMMSPVARGVMLLRLLDICGKSHLVYLSSVFNYLFVQQIANPPETQHIRRLLNNPAKHLNKRADNTFRT